MQIETYSGDIRLLDVTKPGMLRVKLTPEQARFWLELNTNNRLIRKTLVDYLVRAIDLGEWQEEHPQPMAFSASGLLMDGQHRLLAIAKSHVSHVWVTVVFGVPDKVREHIDTGIVRTLYDRVQFVSDPKQNKVVSQLVNSLWFVLNRSRYGGKLAVTDARALFDKHRESIVFASNYDTHRREIRIGLLVSAICMYEANADKASDFMDSYCRPVTEVTQAALLKNWMLTKCPCGGGYNIIREIFERSSYAMNAYLENRQITRLMRMRWDTE